MINEEMDRAIAQAVGWKPTADGGICWDGEGNAIITPPAYSTDLNAMKIAEDALTDEQYLNYTLLLMDDYQSIGCVSRHSSATAEDRAINFLRTIGKYSDATHTLP